VPNDSDRTKVAIHARVDTDLLGLSTKEFLERIAAHNFELAAISWDPDFADPWSYLADYRSDSGAANFGHMPTRCSITFWINLSRPARTPCSALRLLEAAERRLIDNEAVIPLRFGVVDFIVNVHLKGWRRRRWLAIQTRYLRIEGAPRPSRRSSARRRVPSN